MTTTYPLFNFAQSQKNQPLDAFIEYLSLKNLELYPAQEEAILELFTGKNVILNTPTGSGKSLVATAFHFYSMTQNRRSIYTCPIKALVNEKFLALCKDFGPNQVGMITGDATINPDAPIICCTAEILSNLALRWGDKTPFQDIIMDEFHYYSDRDRGVAWQIPLLTLKNARFLLMSATLGDTTFFETALTELTGAPTILIRSTQRPVPLDFEYSERALHFKIADLIALGKSPIYLVNFTQRECAEEAQNLLSVDFCSKEEKKTISEQLEDVNFKTPYGKDLQRLLKHGVGLHHAGLLPRYRVLVEKLAQKGLLKVICGTDTLGVGVNVPIRTVLFTKLCKYDGQKTTILSVRDFQQISGRAGRKGFDDKGTVVIQAPSHIIENLTAEKKATNDPKKSKKFVKAKPPEKGFLPWNQDTLIKLSQGQPEPLVSRFQVSHAMVLNVLSREGTSNCNTLRELISKSHESPNQKKRHHKLAFQLFRSLHDRNIIELNPLRINIDLQEDFSLNHALSLYMLDTVKILDLSDPLYALNILTLAESIVENPDLILRRQVDRLKTIRMQELKLSGMEYEERIEELEKIEHPKPLRDFIYDTFNSFAATHPWVGAENIRPKSIAREMYEGFLSFHEYIKEYGLERIEGLLLRYLSEIYKILVQTLPESHQTDELISIIEYFKEMLLMVDSSLVDEWESMRNPALAAQKQALARQKEAKNEADRLEKLFIEKEKKKKIIHIRNEIFRALRDLASENYIQASERLSCEPQTLEQAIKIYQSDHKAILLDQNARSNKYLMIDVTGEESWNVEQTLTDPDGHNDWVLKITATWSDLKPHLRFSSLGPN